MWCWFVAFLFCCVLYNALFCFGLLWYDRVVLLRLALVWFRLLCFVLVCPRFLICVVSVWYVLSGGVIVS